jgi:hypothetical protein
MMLGDLTCVQHPTGHAIMLPTLGTSPSTPTPGTEAPWYSNTTPGPGGCTPTLGAQVASKLTAKPPEVHVYVLLTLY